MRKLLQDHPACTCGATTLMPRAADPLGAHDSTSTDAGRTRALLQLGRSRHCSSLHNCLGSHRTIRLGSFLRSIPHSNTAQGPSVQGSAVPGLASEPEGLSVQGSAVPGLASEPAVLAQALAWAAKSPTS